MVKFSRRRVRQRRGRGSAPDPLAGYVLNGVAPAIVMDNPAGLYGLDSVSMGIEEIMDFSRSTEGTRINSSGNLVTTPAGVPRIDHDPRDNSVRGLLMEHSATNILPHSVPNPSDWSEEGFATVVAGDATLLGQPASLLDYAFDGSGSFRISLSTATPSQNAGYVSWCLVRSVDADRINLRAFCSGGTVVDAYSDFNLSTGAAIGASGTLETGHINYGNGIYLLWIRYNTSAGTTDINFRVGHPITVTPNGSRVHIIACQTEQGIYPSSYIPTSGVPVTRAVDIARTPTSNFGFNVNEGSVFVEWERYKGSTGMVFDLSDGTNQESFRIRADNVGSNSKWRVEHNGSFSVNQKVGKPSNNVPRTHAMGWAVGDSAVSTNGGGILSNGVLVLPDGISSITYGMSYASTQQLRGRIRRLLYYPTRLPNSILRNWD